MARKHLEYFEADKAKVEEGAQGRNRAIVLGQVKVEVDLFSIGTFEFSAHIFFLVQVGIRCIHCSHLTRKEKSPAAAFYPSKLAGLYQVGSSFQLSHQTVTPPL